MLKLKEYFFAPPLVEGPAIMFNVPNPFGVDPLPITTTVTTTWAIIVFFAILFWWGTKKMKLVPSKKQVFFEMIFNFYDSFVEGTFGKKRKAKYLLYIATLFSFLVVANIITFFPIPGFTLSEGKLIISPLFRAPTADMNTTVGLALITTANFLLAAIMSQGVWGYIKGLAAPVPFMLPLNIIGEFAKPINISMRLFGNMFAGMVILGLLYKAAPMVIPAPLHLYFDLFSGIVQSFVFTMLTMVYINSSLGDEEAETV